MEAVKKALRNVIDREQKRSLLVTLSHDQELIIKGDNVSVSNLEENETMKNALKTILTEMTEEDETSYNFGGQLTFAETDILDFPKLFAKIGGKKWKGGEIHKILGKYFSLLGFGKNATKTYGKAEDKPAWWPKNPKWKDFRAPSKASKDECTLLIKLLLEHYSLDPSIYYMNYPDEEMEDSSNSSDSSEEEDEEEYEENEQNSDLDGHLKLSEEGSDDGNVLDENNGNDLAARVNALADRCEAGNPNTKRREERISELQERFREHERLMEQEEQDRLREKNRTKRRNYVEIDQNKKKKGN